MAVMIASSVCVLVTLVRVCFPIEIKERRNITYEILCLKVRKAHSRLAYGAAILHTALLVKQHNLVFVVGCQSDTLNKKGISVARPTSKMSKKWKRAKDLSAMVQVSVWRSILYQNNGWNGLLVVHVIIGAWKAKVSACKVTLTGAHGEPRQEQ